MYIVNKTNHIELVISAILNKVKHFELQTDQVVVAMETQLCDHSPGLNASFTSFTIEAVLQHNTKGKSIIRYILFQ